MVKEVVRSMRKFFGKSIWNSFLILSVFIFGCTVQKSFLGKSGVNKNSDIIAIKYKANILESKNSYDLSGTIKIDNVNKSIFCNSVSSIYGIEVFRFIIRNDSLYYINRVKKEYYEGAISDFQQLNNATFSYSIIKACLLADFKEKNIIGDFKNLEPNNNIVFDSVVYNENGLAEEYLFENNQSGKIYFKYKEYFKRNGFPKILEILIKSNKNIFRIEIDYVSVLQGNDPIHLFTCPKNYTIIK